MAIKFALEMTLTGTPSQTVSNLPAKGSSNTPPGSATATPRPSTTLATIAERSILTINPLIYAEVSIGFPRIETLDDALPVELYRREPLPFEAGFLAGKCFMDYRRRGGLRTSPLPAFYIGAHASLAGYRLMTRDTSRFRTYFPQLELIAP